MNIKNPYTITAMNIELTTRCPLRCPQCYCSLEGQKDIPLDIAVSYLKQAKTLGLQRVELSGGETLCYPWLYELISEASSLGIKSDIAISGWGFDENVLKKLRDAGLSHIFVSLNGPTQELNALSRDGYKYAIIALSILKNYEFPETNINWVMHRNTADYLPEMIQLAKEYKAKSIVIMAPKPTNRNELNTFPTKKQMERAVEYLRGRDGNYLQVECCFSQLLAMTKQTVFLGNLNTSLYKGCGAGRFMVSVSVDGKLSPCRHLECFEQWEYLEDYWNKSPVLKEIRGLEEKKEMPCNSCSLSPYCRHCLAVNYKLDHRLYIGNSICTIPETPANS